MFRVGSPVPVEELRENLRFRLALVHFLIALLVFGIVLGVRINRRQEHDALPVRQPDAAIRARGNVGDLARLAVESAAFRGQIGYPDLGRIGRLRCPDQAFSVGRKARSLFVVGGLVQPARFPASRRNDPEMRDLCIRIQIDIDRVEHNPFAVRRRHRRTDTFQFHHVLERERMLGCRIRARARARGRARARRCLGQERTGQCESECQDFPMHRRCLS